MLKYYFFDIFISKQFLLLLQIFPKENAIELWLLTSRF